MARVKRGVTSHARHKKVLKQVKGQYGRRKNTIRIAKQALDKALQLIHCSENNNDLNSAVRRLKFDEHFFLQLLVALKKYNIQKVGHFGSFGVQDCPVVQFDVKHAGEMTFPKWKARTKRKISALRIENKDEDSMEAAFWEHHLKPNAKTEYASDVDGVT